jgi:anti-anti-sigma factor
VGLYLSPAHILKRAALRVRVSRRRSRLRFSPYFLACEMSCSEFFPHGRIVAASLQERLLDFSATIRHLGQASLIDLRGRLTFFEVGVLRENIARLLGEGHKHLVLNLSALQYLDSSGVGELARMYVMVLMSGGEM